MTKFFSLIKQNLASGIAVSIVSICLSIPLAIASGATPMQGIFAAMWWGFFASLFGSSNYNIIGPAGALTGLLISFVLAQGAEWLPYLTILIAWWIFLIWLLRISKYITLIPSTALHGFMLGIGLIIATGQLNNIFWLTGLVKHSSMLANLSETVSHIADLNPRSIAIFFVSFLFLKGRNRYIRKIPAILPVTIIGILFGVIMTKLWHHSFMMLKDQFPALAFQMRDLGYSTSFSKIDRPTLMMLLSASFPIAIVAILETIISAKVADRQTNTKHHQEKEVFGLSLANLASGLVGGIPCTGVFVRTALNIKSGATSRVSACINTIFVGLISWLLFSSFVYLPLAVMAAILCNLALGMIDIPLYKKLWNYDSISFWLVMIVGILTYLEDPIVGIIVGVIGSLLLYLKDVSEGNLMVNIFRRRKFYKRKTLKSYVSKQEDGDVVVVKFPKDMTFVNMTNDLEMLETIYIPKKIIFSFSQTQYIDMDGLEGFEELAHDYSARGIERYISGLGWKMEILIRKLHCVIEADQDSRIFVSSSVALESVL
jgi:sulfate permease, SulP family